MAELASYLAGKQLDKIYFMHLGRELLFDDKRDERVRELFGGKAVITFDGMTVTVGDEADGRNSADNRKAGT